VQERVRKTVALSALVLLGTAVALFAVEAVLRVMPSANRYYVWPPYTRRVWQPPPEIFPGIFGTSRFTVSSDGVRGRELGAIGTEYRILAIGGSTTEAGAVDDSEAWTALVEQRLGRTADGRSTWVGNVGRSGMNSRDHVLHVRYLSTQYPGIDALLILVGVNDLTVTLAQGEQYVPPPSLAEPSLYQASIERAFSVAPGHFREYLLDGEAVPAGPWYKNTATWNLVRRTRRIVEMRFSDAALEDDTEGQNLAAWRKQRQAAPVRLEHLPNLSLPLSEYRLNLNAIADLAKARRQRLIFLTQPTIWRAGLTRAAEDRCWLGGTGDFQRRQSPAYYSVEALAEAMRLFNETLLQVANERGIEVIDLAAKIAKDESNFFDDAHFTELGERRVADVVVEYLGSQPPYAHD